MANMVEPPEHFICPLTLEVMKHPFKNVRTGHTYEREAILEWMFLHGNGTCPFTRQRIRPSDFKDDAALQHEIRVWKVERDIDQKLAWITAFSCGLNEPTEPYRMPAPRKQMPRKPILVGNGLSPKISC
jgi:U-box domain